MPSCLGSITGRVNCDDTLFVTQKSALSEINTASPTFIKSKDMHGNVETVYHVNFIYLLDRVFLKDSMSFLSIEQTDFMNNFFKEAHIVTELLDLKLGEEAYEGMTNPMFQLDNFLGTFVGENNEQFTR